ncbi:hypothetical protein [Nonomuraea lactucae]|uniref:hypothetical protein n=1 Tax=Nonomuraea lactucae TaxID=2249762 RepID=UPI001F0635CB|nr:hypothetical protein [Nonomuraea lactucae]
MSEMDTRGDDVSLDVGELSIEAPEADAAEQQRQVQEERGLRGVVPFEADPADAADQERVVDLDDDDYR